MGCPLKPHQAGKMFRPGGGGGGGGTSLPGITRKRRGNAWDCTCGAEQKRLEDDSRKKPEHKSPKPQGMAQFRV